MLTEATTLLLGQLNQYMHHQDGSPPDDPDPAVAGNIGQLDQQATQAALENHVVLTLTGVEEEGTLKNGPTVTRDPSAGLLYQNPPLHLNLYLLFTANFQNYQTALRRLAQVLTFFQGKRHFTTSNSPGAASGSGLPLDLSLSVDLISLSFEEANHLWGSLGGKQLPFVVYRARLVTLSDRRAIGGGGDILEVDVIGRSA